MSNERKSSLGVALQPIALALALAGGLYIGSNLSSNSNFIPRSSPDEANPNKLVNIINFIEANYVDSVKRQDMIDDAITSIVEELDPHSYYISQEEFASFQEPLEGNFEGIGVEFMITDDTLSVVSPIQGGPSQEAGIEPGDQIVTVDEEVIAGIGLTNERVMKLLKGEKGSKVNLGVRRKGKRDLLAFSITRDRIPIYSVVADFMVNEQTGYIKVTRFAKNTYEDFKAALEKLKANGAQSLIIDLRGNGGGYLGVANDMIEEFLNKGDLIVYTEGNNSPYRPYAASRDGEFKDVEVAILINQGSASASEIMAGAMQDHDRALIVGRRSFGKGLVQEEIALPDESALRLTVARYYTPTGRSIQKPYGEGIDYANDYMERYERGEMISADSISFPDSLKYITPAGRIVYGGGGIMPDVFVPIDTISGSPYLNQLAYEGVFRRFGFEYGQNNVGLLEQFPTVQDFRAKFGQDASLLKELVVFANAEGVEERPDDMKRSKVEILVRAKAYVAKQLYGEQALYFMLLDQDNEFQKALEIISKGDQFAAIMNGKVGA